MHPITISFQKRNEIFNLDKKWYKKLYGRLYHSVEFYTDRIGIIVSNVDENGYADVLMNGSYGQS